MLGERPSLRFDHSMPLVFLSWSLLQIGKISPAYSRWQTVGDSGLAIYSFVSVQCFCWGTPYYNSLFHRSNGILAPDTGSSFIYNPPSAYKTTPRGNRAVSRVPLFIFFRSLVTPEGFAFEWVYPLIIFPLNWWWNDNIDVPFFMYCSNIPLFPLFQSGSLLTK
jgi:hypothetical protein